MEEFIRNHRRVPRVPVRLRVLVNGVGGDFIAQTEDVGPGGCRILSPFLVANGDLLRLSIDCDAFSETLKVSGKVVWASARARLRAGVQYDEASRPAAEAWFAKLLERNPAIAARLNPVPKLLAFSTLLFRNVGEVSPQVHTVDERAVFEQIKDGMTVRDLMPDDVPRRRDRSNALFALIATGAVRIDTGGGLPRLSMPAAPPARATPGSSRPSAIAAAARDARSGGQVATYHGPGAPAGGEPTPGVAIAAGAAPPGRSPEAQEKFERAQRLAAEGKMSAAIPLLRDALRMSPRDAAIAALLARAAFGGGK